VGTGKIHGVCDDIAADGHCATRPLEWMVVWGNRLMAIMMIAYAYGIHLAPGDYWIYEKTVVLPDKSQPWGFTPDREDQVYTTGSGLKTANDNTSIITNRLFIACGINIDCFAGIMAHEATHSWIEYRIEERGFSINPKDATYYFASEIIADEVALSLKGGDPYGYIQQHLDDRLPYFPGSNSIDYLYDTYGLIIDPLSLIWYGFGPF
jgi:hypothetical protein